MRLAVLSAYKLGETLDMQGDMRGMVPQVKEELLDILPQSLASSIIPNFTGVYGCPEPKDQVCSGNTLMMMSTPLTMEALLLDQDMNSHAHAIQ